LQSEYQTTEKSFTEQGFCRLNRFIWDPENPFLFLVEDRPSVSVFSRELFADEGNVLLSASQKKLFKSMYTSWFVKNMQDKHFDSFIDHQRWLRTNSSLSLSNDSFRSNTLLESYQYLSNLFLSNERLFDQMAKRLLRTGWLFPDEIIM